MYYKNTRILASLGAWMFVLLLALLPAFASAQTFAIDPDPANTSDPTGTYYVGETQLKATANTFAGFSNGDKFYYYYVPTGQPNTLDQDLILDQANFNSWTTQTFTGYINTLGDYDLYVGQFDGRFDYETELSGDDVDVMYGGTPTTGTFSETKTYFGDIQTEFSQFTGGCILGELTVNIPEGAVITGVDVQYDMTAANNGWMVDQRSRISCVSSGGTTEATYSSGAGMGGTYSYARNNLDIANGVVGGGDITFQMQAYRTWGNAAEDCGIYYNKVDNGTWSVTVNYELAGFPYAFNLSGNRQLTTNVFNLAGETAGDVILDVNLTSVNADVNYPILIEYSTNGGANWTSLEDLAANTEFYNGQLPVNIELPLAALNANTQFRVRQENSAGLAAGNFDFVLSSMFIYKGTDITGVFSSMVGTYTIEENLPPVTTPQIWVTDIVDEATSNTVYNGVTEFGQVLTVEASTLNITLADYNYLLYYEDRYIEPDAIRLNQVDPDNGEVEIDFTIPLHFPYNDNKNVQIVVIDGDELIAASGAANYDLIDDYTATELNILGGTKSGDAIAFNLAGERQFVTPAEEILSISGATLEFTLTRLSPAIPAAGNEVVLEYSTDGNTWTQIGIDYALGGEFGVGTGGRTYNFDEATLPAGIVSANTQFRVRQLNVNNGGDVNTWQIEHFVFDQPGTGSNVIASSDYNPDWIYQDLPTFTIALNNPDMSPIFPGETVSFLVENVVGDFPAGTLFEVYYDGIWLKTLASPSNFNIIAPLDNGFKTLTLRAEFDGQFTAASANFTIQPVSVAITGVDYDIIDSDTEYSIPGDDISVTYDFNGYIQSGLEASIILQVYNPATTEYETFGTQVIDATINTNQGGTITAALPTYAYGATADLRIYIENYPWTDGDYGDRVIERNLATTWDDGEDWSYYYGAYNNLDLQFGSKVAFPIYVDENFEGDFEYVYWDVPGDMWVPFGDTISVPAGYIGYVNHYADMNDFVDIPEELIGYTGDLWIGVRHTNTLDPNLSVTGVRIIEPRIKQYSTVGTTINVLYPSVTLAEMNPTYNYGLEADLQYTTYAIDASEQAWFAITLEQPVAHPELYHVIAESNQLGQIDLAGVVMPTREELAALGFDVSTTGPLYTSDFKVNIYAYTKDEFDVLWRATVVKTLNLTDADFLEIAGYNSGTSRFDYNGGDRFAITKPFDFSETNQPITLLFDYAASIGTVTLGTLPYLQVSNDGGQTFTTLTVDESVYSAYDRLPASGSQSFSVEIPSMYVTANTVFRWIQDVTVDSWWTISNISYTAGHSNLVDFDVSYYNTPQDIQIEEYVFDPYADYNNINTYEWDLVDADPEDDFDPFATVAQDFDYTWKVLTDTEGEPIDIVWPEGTVFQFSIVAKDIADADTVYIFESTPDTGALVAQMVEDAGLFIKTGLYNISARALIYEDSAGIEILAHSYPDMADPAEVVDQILVVNDITQDHYEIVLEQPVAVNEDETDADFHFESRMATNYETFGPYDDSVRFQTVLEGKDTLDNMVYYNLKYLPNALGAILDTVDIPEKNLLIDEGFCLDSNIYAKVYAYFMEEEGDEFVYDIVDVANLTDPSEDFLAVNDGEGYDSLVFNGVEEIEGVYTKRYAITESLETYYGLGAIADNQMLMFDYTGNLGLLTYQTVPRLEVTIDAGETYTYVPDYLLLDDGSYQLDITQEWLDNASNVHFRWIQDYPEGDWTLSNVRFTTGESNWYFGAVSNEWLVDISDLPSGYPDAFANYELLLEQDAFGFDLAVNVNEDTDFEWSIIDTELADEIWPEGTVFEFSIELKDENDDPYDYIIGSVTDTNTFVINLPDSLFITGAYDVAVRAYVTDGEGTYTYPALNEDDELTDPDAPIVIKSILVVNLTQEDVLRLVVEDLEIDEEQLIPEYFLDEEFTINFELFGEWPVGVEFGATLEQLDDVDSLLARDILNVVSSTENSITVQIPEFISKHDDFDKFQIRVYSHVGGSILNFGDPVEILFEEIIGEDDVNELEFSQDGDRQALSEVMDLSGYTGATVLFDYVADNIIENPSTLPRLMVTNDGVTFEALEVPESDFGAQGYLPSNGAFALTAEVPATYLTATTQFLFIQEVNRGVDKDVWTISNVELADNYNIFADFLEENNPQEVDIIMPELANYEWKIVRDANGFEPVLYAGSTSEFTFKRIVTEDGDTLGIEYPEGTEFSFYLQNYPEDDSLYLLEVTYTNGVYEFTLPEDIQRDTYPVVVNIALGDNVFVNVEDEVVVGAINVFNPLLVTTYEQPDVLYAGNSTDFIGVVENNVTTLNTDWYYNLVMIDNTEGEEWLLSEQLGSLEFTNIALPTFKGGEEFDFEIRASIDNPIGVAGELIETTEELLWADEDLVGTEGERVTLEDDLDLTNWPYIEFDVEIADIDITTDQQMVFEYSINDGAEYTVLGTYPNAMFVLDEDDDMYKYSEFIEFPAEAITENTIVRFRIEQFMEPFTVKNVKLVDYIDYTPAPVAYEAASIFVAEQRIDITSTDELAYCIDGSIEINYDIQGVFGADNIVTVFAEGTELEIGGDLLEFEGITQGSGTITVDLSEITNAPTAGYWELQLQADDQTVEDYGFTVLGEAAEYDIEIVPEINANTAVWAGAVNVALNESCEDAEHVAVISNVQENFSYQIYNFYTGVAIGDPVVVDVDDEDLMDPDTYPFYNGTNLEILIGTITQLTKVEVQITSMNEAGDLVCDVQVPNSQATFDLRPLYTLHYNIWDDGYTGIWTPVTDGQAFTLCGEDADNLVLSMGYWKNGQFVSGDANFYRNDLGYFMANTDEYDMFPVSGTYFAVYDDGECGEYQSVSVDITVNEKPDQPEITIDGESLLNVEICHDGSVVLDATTGYSYYRWFLDGNVVFGNNQSVTVNEAGIYQVEVSNIPFGQACPSDKSQPVNVIVNDIPDVAFAVNTVNLCYNTSGIIYVTVFGLVQDVTYTLVDNLTGDVYAEFATTNNQLTFETLPITATSQFYIHASHDVNGCTKVVTNNLLTVNVLPQYEILASNEEFFVPAGGLSFCEGVELGIGENDGTLANVGTVNWYMDDLLVGNGFTFDAMEAGVYTAEWILPGDCSYITQTVTIGGTPERPEITAQGDLEFCEGEGNLVLSAPEGYASYNWIGNNINIISTDNELNVVRTGDYQVRVVNEAGCESNLSSTITAVVHPKPFTPILNHFNGTVLCEPGFYYVLVGNFEHDVLYQLYDVITGLPTGEARMGSANLVLTSDSLKQNAVLEVRASRIDVEGCDVVTPPFDVRVYNHTILVSGNTLTSSIPPVGEQGNYGAISYQWYRDGIMIQNGGNDRSIKIYDDARYDVDVVTAEGCELTTQVGEPVVETKSAGEGSILNIYPNPASSYLNVSYTSNKEEQLIVKIINTSGNVVSKSLFKKLEGEFTEKISVSNLNRGSYIIQVISDSDVKVQQFSKF